MRIHKNDILTWFENRFVDFDYEMTPYYNHNNLLIFKVLDCFQYKSLEANDLDLYTKYYVKNNTPLNPLHTPEIFSKLIEEFSLEELSKPENKIKIHKDKVLGKYMIHDGFHRTSLYFHVTGEDYLKPEYYEFVDIKF